LMVRLSAYVGMVGKTIHLRIPTQHAALLAVPEAQLDALPNCSILRRPRALPGQRLRADLPLAGGRETSHTDAHTRRSAVGLLRVGFPVPEYGVPRPIGRCATIPEWVVWPLFRLPCCHLDVGQHIHWSLLCARPETLAPSSDQTSSRAKIML
jgi:hypothetical protein